MMARMTSTKTTEAKWAERVRAWRESGETAQEFARNHGFAASTLHGWSSRLSQATPPDLSQATPAETPRLLRLVPKPPSTTSTPELVIEVGQARVHVGKGFDAALLSEVVRALGGGSR